MLHFAALVGWLPVARGVASAGAGDKIGHDSDGPPKPSRRRGA